MRISDWSSDVCSSDLCSLRWPRASVAAPPAGVRANSHIRFRQALLRRSAWVRRKLWKRDPSPPAPAASHPLFRSEEHTSELQSLMRISYAVFCLKKKTKKQQKIYSKTISNDNHTTKRK